MALTLTAVPLCRSCVLRHCAKGSTCTRSIVAASQVFAMADAFANYVTLSPSEYQGDPNTCVAGRVVILRGPVELRPQENVAASASQPAAAKGSSKGKKNKGGKAKKGTTPEVRVKSELHLLGGASAAEILFGDAWAGNANDLPNHIELGKVYRIAGSKYIAKPPEYSTSRLPYFIRFEGKFGTQIKIAECSDNPWADAPLFHPLADIENLSRVGGKMQMCIAGLLTYQPGLVDRDTQWGPGRVCNAVLKQGDHDIRFSFWRDSGAKLAAVPVGTIRAYLQVNVVQTGGSWECRATEATQIVECPAEIEAAIRNNTDQNAAATSLTKQVNIEYDTAPSKTTTLSALASIIAAKGSRDMPGVYELHNAAVLGVSAVLGDGSFQMLSCKECFQRVEPGTPPTCAQHPNAGAAPRWIFALELADGETSLQATLYNDAASTLTFLPDGGDVDGHAVKQRIIQGFRAAPWSFRLVLKPDLLKDTNYVEIKRLTHTLTAGGVVETYDHRKSPRAAGFGRPGCPLARCIDVHFDADFGVVRCHGVDAVAVRILVQIEAQVEDVDPDIATPDPTNRGLRVSRKVTCVLNPEDKTRYSLVTSGLVSGVQWLLTAAPGAVFFVTATATTAAVPMAPIEFRALAFMDVAPIGAAIFATHMKEALAHTKTVDVAFTPSRATPQSRKRAIDDTAEEASKPSGTFSKRVSRTT
jgi:hypothetical protein